MVYRRDSSASRTARQAGRRPLCRGREAGSHEPGGAVRFLAGASCPAASAATPAAMCVRPAAAASAYSTAPSLTAHRRRTRTPLRSRCSTSSVRSMLPDAAPTAASAAAYVPQGIPLHLLNRKFIKDIDEFYGEYPGRCRSGRQQSPLTSFTFDDVEPGVTGGRR